MSEDPPRRSVSDDDVVALANEAIEQAREDARRVDNDDAPQELQKPGITIDLGHKNISRLPEEVIDIIKDEIERLALSHNQISSLPSRLSECKRLRYLNVRYNSMRELPPPVLQLFSLEILDVSKNKIKVLPDEIASLTSLKVLAIQRNKIEKLPFCLGEIGSLQVLKLDGNPIVFPPPEICTIKKDTPAPSNENEKDAVITSQVKRYLRQIATRERLKIESEGDSSESTIETPKPLKRMMSGRFPVKPSISGFDSLEAARPDSPGIAQLSSSRSHFRGQSQQSSNGRRPVISPLIISNERNRSASEGASSTTIRAKRGGLVIKNVSELGNVNEVRSRTTEHGRTNSQGSLLSGSTLNGAGVASSSSSFSSSEGPSQRTITHRPLSDLLEHKRRSRAPDVVVEAAKTVLYALTQLHKPILQILQKTKFSEADSGRERGMHFRRRVHDSVVYVRQLNSDLEKFDTLAEEDDEDATNLSAMIRKDLQSCLNQYFLITVCIYDGVKEINRDADPRVVRTLLLNLQGGTAEIRNACSVLGVEFQNPVKDATPRSTQPSHSTSSSQYDPSRNYHRTRSKANGVPYQSSIASNGTSLPEFSSSGASHSRSTTQSSISSVTPRSGETFAALSARPGPHLQQDREEEARFETIYLKLRTATERITKVLPNYRHFFQRQRLASESSMEASAPRIRVLADLVQKSDNIITSTDVLSRRLSAIKLKDPTARGHPDFWQQSTTFCKLWGDFATLVMESSRFVALPDDLRRTLKPIHKAIKDVSLEINASPWSHLSQSNSQLIPAAPLPMNTMSSTTSSFMSVPSRPGTSLSYASNGTTPTGPIPAPIPNPINTSTATMSGASQSPAQSGLLTPAPPATPLSAALGPAAQATLPGAGGNSQTASSSIPTLPAQAGFPGTSVVFERADRLLSNTQRRV